MREWNEQKLNQEMEELLRDMPEQVDLEKKINQSIDKRIRRTVLRTLSGVTVVLLVAFWGISPLMNLLFFNPYKLNQEPEQEMFEVLRDYWETVQPFQEIISLDVKKKGFARYELEMQVADLKGALAIGESNVWCEVNFGKYENFVDASKMMIHNIGRFSCGGNQEEILETICELPKSAKIYLSVSDTKPKSLTDLKNQAVRLEWIQMYQPQVRFQAGLRIIPRAQVAEDDIRGSMTEQELIRVYLSNLENLLEHEEVWCDLGLNDGSSRLYSNVGVVLKETYEDAKKLTAITSENYCVYGKRDIFLWSCRILQ